MLAQQIGQHVVEIGGVPRQAREAQDRRVARLALILVPEPQIVGGAELGHQSRATSAGISDRSVSTCAGVQGSRSIGAPVRLTQAVRKP